MSKDDNLFNFISSFPLKRGHRDDSNDEDSQDDITFTKKKKKYIHIDEKYDPGDDDHYGGSSKNRSTSTTSSTRLGLKLDEDVFEIKKIKDKLNDIPREDGYQWKGKEKFLRNVENRPFGKEFIDEHTERLKILNSHPDYKFIKEIAGAMRKEPFELIEEEDMNRLLRDRENERLRTQLIYKRTVVTMEKKESQIKKSKEAKQAMKDRLRSMVRDYHNNPSKGLILLSDTLIESNVYTNIKDYRSIDMASFLNIKSLYDMIIEGSTFSSPFNTSKKNKFKKTMDMALNEIDVDLDNESKKIGKSLKMYTNDDEKKMFMLILFTYYRDILNNDRHLSVKDSITLILKYIINIYKNGDSFSSDNAVTVKNEPGVSDAQQQQDDAQEDDKVLTKIVTTMGIDNPLNLLNKELRPILIDYKFMTDLLDHTETIHLDKLYLLGITNEQEREMILEGCLHGYEEEEYSDYREYIEVYLFGSENDNKVIRTQTMQKGRPVFNVFSDNIKEGGHPSSISELIKLVVPDFANLVKLKFRSPPEIEAIEKTIKLILKSHFLWHYFENHPWYKIVDLIYSENIKSRMTKTLGRISDILNVTMQIYYVLLASYFTEIIKYFNFLDTDNGIPFINLPKESGKIVNAISQDSFLPNGFNQLNDMFKKVNIETLINDKMFLLYYHTGKHSLVFENDEKEAEEDDKEEEDEENDGEDSKEVRISDMDYPIVKLHYIFRKWNKYKTEHIAYLERSLINVDRAIAKAMAKINEIMSEENMNTNSDQLNRNLYTQKKSYTTQPIISGVVSLKAEIVTMISRAYHKVQQWCPELRGLELSNFHSPHAREVGLTSAFVEFLTTLSADNELLFPEQYKSKHQSDHVTKRLKDTMVRMQGFRYNGNSIYNVFYGSSRPSPSVMNILSFR